MPMDNNERSEHAANALSSYLRSKGEPSGPPLADYELSDLIYDLLHLGDRLGYNHRTLIECALLHYEAENQDQA